MWTKHDECFTQSGISYVTKLKNNTSYQGLEESDILYTVDTRIIEDEIIDGLPLPFYIVLIVQKMTPKIYNKYYWVILSKTLLSFIIS